jgi:2-polyprenyl-6-methoxyphenol hydroxylase-like FAD-dependent oxidoreductase
MDEVLIVGAGPAGLSAALALSARGLAVTVFEQHPAPPPRVCGAFINPEGTRHLATLGVLDEVRQAGAVAVTTARLAATRDREVDIPIDRDGVSGLAVPRPVLEQVLADNLTRRGGVINWGSRVAHANRDDVGWCLDIRNGTATSQRRAPLLIAADGRFSSLSGRQPTRGRQGWFGWNATWAGVQNPPGHLSLHFYRSGYVGVLVFGDGLTNVCGLTRRHLGDSTTSWEEVCSHAVGEQPALAHLLRGANRVSAFRGVGPLPFSSRMWSAGGPLLAGDAAAVGDPYMGEGISRALGTGPALLASLGDAHDVADATIQPVYARVWRQHYHPRLRLGTATRLLLAHPRVMSAMLGVAPAAWLRRLAAVAHR